MEVEIYFDESLLGQLIQVMGVVLGPVLETLYVLYVDNFAPELPYKPDRETIMRYIMKQARSYVFLHMPEELDIVEIIERPPTMQGPVQEFDSIDSENYHPWVSQSDSTFFVFLKMFSLYNIWWTVSTMCEWNALGPLLLNDGGKFYNECYYMFYNGVVWYRMPRPY